MEFPFILEKGYNFLWDFYKYIDEKKPIWIEIGSGNGDYIVEIADRNRDKYFIGIEIKYKRLLKTLKKVKKRNLKNVILFHCSGEIFVNFFLKDNSIDAVILNFPDPWFKKKHQKRKLLNHQFVNELLPKMKIHSKLYIATDYENYALQIFELLSKIKNLKNLNNPKPFGDKWLYKDIFTKYEKEFLKEGKKIYYLAFEKVSQ